MEIKILKYLNENYKEVALHKICCRHEPKLERDSVIINVCAGCDRRFRSLYEGITTISLWEIIDKLDFFPFPDYQGVKISIHDPCPVRERREVHQAVRNLLKKMNFTVTEAKFIRKQSICCGDDFYQKIDLDEVHERMKQRAASMPCEDVCVYCVSCIKAMYVGGKSPRHLLDLLMGESTEPQIYDTETWHQQLQEYIDVH
jgi:Fe-S oxidoreductase